MILFRAPEMIDIYNGQPITIKADIWVSVLKSNNSVIYLDK